MAALSIVVNDRQSNCNVLDF